jgi:excisionase family DNA binding protein
MAETPHSETAQNYQPDFLSGRERLYTVDEAARRLELSHTSVRQLIRRGDLGYVLKVGLHRKVYHIPASALRACQAEREALRDLKRVRQANQRLVRHLALLRERLGEADENSAAKGRRKKHRRAKEHRPATAERSQSTTKGTLPDEGTAKQR